MTESRRPFRDKDIPLTSEDNILLFNYPELSKIMYKSNNDIKLMHDIMNVVYDKINECEARGVENIEVMKAHIAGGLNRKLYPQRAGIKEEINHKIKPMFPGETYPNIEIKYINIDDLLDQTKGKESTFFEVGIDAQKFAKSAFTAITGKQAKEQKLKASDIEHSPYPSELMYDYGFNPFEAKEIGFKKNFTIDEVMEIVRKTAKQVKSKTKVKLIDEIINIFKN